MRRRSSRLSGSPGENAPMLKPLIPFRVFRSLILAGLLAIGFGDPVLAQEGERELPSEALGQPATAWFDPKVCARPAGRKLYVRIGSAVLALPLENVRALMPSQISRMTGSAGKVMMRIGRTAGCPEAPFPTVAVTLLEVKNVGTGMIVLSATPDNAAAFDAQLAKIRDSGSCPSASPGLIYCKGSRTTASGRQEVAYVIAADPDMRQTSGGPLRALCILEGAERCSVLDDLPGGVRFELAVGKAPSLQRLQQIDAQGRSYVQSLRVRG